MVGLLLDHFFAYKHERPLESTFSDFRQTMFVGGIKKHKRYILIFLPAFELKTGICLHSLTLPQLRAVNRFQSSETLLRKIKKVI